MVLCRSFNLYLYRKEEKGWDGRMNSSLIILLLVLFILLVIIGIICL
ncbi:YjcZ family sporulation protein [Bacillus pseudomycoides]|uniref:YjcZ family sporulation protein n=1 Tax=Bacillus bingmayongensis TaxID=1150157 RepID=A0ABU5JS38_9BACI|nr:YjcZ family sporulation protein [Bacillus pseudomycoides]